MFHRELYRSRSRFDRNKSLTSATAYIEKLEAYIPNEIIDEYIYADTFKQVLTLVKETFRPDQFDSYFGGLFHWLNFDFMEWLLAHQNELKRRLTWNQLCELQCNWMGWRILDIPDMTIREIWEFNDEKQKDVMYEKLRSRKA